MLQLETIPDALFETPESFNLGGNTNFNFLSFFFPRDVDGNDLVTRLENSSVVVRFFLFFSTNS